MVRIHDLRELIRYEPETGALFWKARPLRFFSADRGTDDALAKQARFNTIHAGRPALNAVVGGYLRGRVLYRNMRAHRAAAAIMLGRWPEEVDHINGVGTDNRWANLRPCSRVENARNRRKQAGRSSRFIGVSRAAGTAPWVAAVKLDGRAIRLGAFADEEAAARAYDAAISSARVEFAALNFPEEH